MTKKLNQPLVCLFCGAALLEPPRITDEPYRRCSCGALFFIFLVVYFDILKGSGK